MLPSDLTTAQSGSPRKTGFWTQLTEVSSRLRWFDIAILAVILSFGVFHFFFTERTVDFTRDDVFYADAAHSLLQHHFYGINGHREANQPPGLPALLALLCLAGSCTHIGFLRAMVAFETMGFLCSYELLRRQAPRIVAASICFLLISSRTCFWLATQWVFPSFPYFLVSTLVLLVARKFEDSSRPFSRISWVVLLAVLIAISLLLMSAAMAFLVAIMITTIFLFFRNRPLAISRMRACVAILLFGAAVQGAWLLHKPTPPEWPLPGYPNSYFSQLTVKSGNDPELGAATLADIPPRVLRNAADDSIILSEMLLKRWIDVAWMSILVTGPIVLILLGWGASVWPAGGSIQEWYFVGYEFIYLLWPWKAEPRFFLPLAPLACLYLWRGGKALFFLAKNKPRLLAIVWYPIGAILTIGAWFWMYGAWRLAWHMTHAGLQDETSFAIWLLSSVLAVWMLWTEDSWRKWAEKAALWFRKPLGSSRLSPMRILHVIGMAAVTYLMIIGVRYQLVIGHGNRNRSMATIHLPGDVQAGEWVNAHTPPDAVIMARHVPIVYHYAQRNTVWFPPSTNPQMLMDGIQSHKINYVIVVERDDTFYLPKDEDSFAALYKSFPDKMHLLYQAPGLKIFQVIASAAQTPSVVASGAPKLSTLEHKP